MTSRLSLLVATTALTLVLGLPAVAAMQARGQAPGPCSGVCAAIVGPDDLPAPLIRASSDDDEQEGTRGWVRRGHDDDDDDDDEDCDEDDEDDDCGPARRGPANPAPAGTVAPPANGLFGNGAPPRAVTN